MNCVKYAKGQIRYQSLSTKKGMKNLTSGFAYLVEPQSQNSIAFGDWPGMIPAPFIYETVRRHTEGAVDLTPHTGQHIFPLLSEVDCSQLQIEFWNGVPHCN